MHQPTDGDAPQSAMIPGENREGKVVVLHPDVVPDAASLYVRRAGPNNAFRSFGWLATILVSGGDTGGHFALIEVVAERGAAPPRHVHHREDETIYVLEGEITVHADGAEVPVPAGATMVLPRGREHSFVVESPEARMLTLVSPAGFEDMILELKGPAEPGAASEDGTIERLVSAAARYGCDITGPPPPERR